MADFYVTFLGAHVTFSNDFLSLVTYNDEHHRVAILALCFVGSKDQKGAGLDHMAFTYSELQDLFLAYRQRKTHGILPLWCVNHGPTTSFYYSDPDGNTIETQVDNFNTAEEATDYLKGRSSQKIP